MGKAGQDTAGWLVPHSRSSPEFLSHGIAVTTNQEGAMLLEEALHGAAARAPVQPQHEGAALGIALGLHEPVEVQL